MNKFKYTVQNESGKSVSGVIAAASLDIARDNLTRLGYRILALAPSTEKKASQGKRTFSFEALSPQGKKILGAITTSDEKSAREKLAGVHNLQVLKLTDITEASGLKQEETATVRQEANMVIEKAETILTEITVYDPDYNNIFDAKEDLRYLLKMADLKQVSEKIPALLALLQAKETTQVILEKQAVTGSIKQETEDLISSIKVEAEENVKEPANFYFNTVLEEIRTLSSWLLVFYALYLVVAEIVSEKNLLLPGWAFMQSTLLSPLLFKITLAVLFLHLFCRAKLFFLEKKLSSGILLGVLTLFVVAWTFLI